MINAIATTYARALLEVGIDRGKADEYAEELLSLRDALRAVPELRVFLESPKIPRLEKKVALVNALKGRVSHAVINLVQVLVDRGRQFSFSDIVDSFEALYDEHVGREHVDFISAKPMDEASVKRLVELLSKALDKDIIATQKIDESLLGGVQIRIGDTVVDGTLRARLNEVRERVSARRLGSDLFDES